MRPDQSVLLTLARIWRGLRRRLRVLYYSRVLKSMGKGCSICDGVRIFGPEHITLGDRVAINEDVILQSCEGAGITIGDRVTLSYRSSVITGGLRLSGEGPLKGNHLSSAIVIEDDVWVGAGAIILPGVTVGRGAVVAAGSVVTRDVPRATLVAGVPAKTLGGLSG